LYIKPKSNHFNKNNLKIPLLIRNNGQKKKGKIYNPSHRQQKIPLKTSGAPEWWPVSAPCIWHL